MAKQTQFLFNTIPIEENNFGGYLISRDGARSENLSGQVLMWRVAAAWHLQNLGGRMPTLPTCFRHP